MAKAGDFIRLTRWGGNYIPHGVWGVVTDYYDDTSIDVDIFMGVEIFNELTDFVPKGVPLDSPGDTWVLHEANRLPPHVLVAWTTHQLTHGVSADA